MIAKRLYNKLLSLPDSFKAVMFLFVIAMIGTCVYIFKGHQGGMIVGGILIGLLIFITKPIWLPDNSSPKWFRYIVLSLLEIFAVFYSVWKPIIDSWLKELVKTGKAPAFLKQSYLENSPTLLFSLLLLSSWLLNKLLKDSTGMGKSDKPFSKDIKEPDFNERLVNVCESLNDDLRSIDIKTNWSAKNFVPLEAEVEVQTANGKKRKITDLLRSIKNSDSRLFLVLGDPGSGKSVALRKLCMDLSKEVKATQKIPIYVNLKEWHIDKKWDAKTNPPTGEQLKEFIFKNIKSRDIVLSKFFDKYFDILHEAGHLYYVLDSFDEIPAVLEEKENSELIRQLSEVFYKFLKGGRNQDSQGILSSRIFRKPTAEFQTTTTLEIRPFSEAKIIKTLHMAGVFDKEFIKSIFRDRGDLLPVIRNPFMARLLTEYLEKHPNTLPANQSVLFAEYIDNTLASCSELISDAGSTKEEVKSIAIEMADIMFRYYGLEAKVSDIKSRLPSYYKVDAAIDILTFSRIARSSTTTSGTFSFSHRRFCEYFTVQKQIREDKDLFDLNSIPNDSQWRDALVLYCEVADEEKAKYIANFCWEKIKEINNSADIHSIHCLRFLRDAFKGRIECITDFRDELSNYILSQLNKGKSLIAAKLAVESLGLLEEDGILEGITKTFTLENRWLQETAIKSCRNIKTVSENFNKYLCKYIWDIPVSILLKEYGKYKFDFTLSNSFSKASTLMSTRFYLTIAYVITFVLMSIYIGKNNHMMAVIIIISISLIFYVLYNVKYFYLDGSFSLMYVICMMIFIFYLTAQRHKDYYGYVLIITSISIPLISLCLYWFTYPINKVKIDTNPYKLVLIIMLLALLFFFLEYVSKKAHWVGYIMPGISSVIFINDRISKIIQSIKHARFYKNCITNDILNRSVIFDAYQGLSSSNFFMRRFLDKVEALKKPLTGTWPDENFIKISSNPSLDRIAQIEEKWLGLK